MRHIISALDLQPDELHQLFRRTRSFIGTGSGGGPLRSKIMASLFYEPSTRTRLSFETAMLRAGGTCVGTENASLFSSAAKGETLRDSIRVISGYVDIIVLRHPEEGSAQIASEVSRVPLINGGDGIREHPTQAFLCFYTIWIAIHTGRLPKKDLRIGFYGDMKNSRAIASLLRLLGHHAHHLKIKCVDVPYGGPKGFDELPLDLIEEMRGLDMPLRHMGDMPNPEVDVLYLTRAQSERDKKKRDPLPEHAKIGLAFAEKMPKHAIIMHPLPRNDELASEVDANPRAWYFQQCDHGVPLRYSLMDMLLNGPLH